MIHRKTTLILGAGASVPFGFPTGYELLRQVIAWANINPGQTNPNLFSEFGKAEINEFREALEKSGKVSVDSFLEHRLEFIPIGKKAMAICDPTFKVTALWMFFNFCVNLEHCMAINFCLKIRRSTARKNQTRRVQRRRRDIFVASAPPKTKAPQERHLPPPISLLRSLIRF